MGGKSSSSSSTATATTTSTATSTGVVGDVVQGQQITINQDLPEAATDVFKQLVSLVGQSLDLTRDAGEAALSSTQEFASKAVQPDLSAISGYQKQVYYAIGAVALITLALLFRKK